MRAEYACADFRRAMLSRRQMLQVGALGTLGLSLPAALRAEARSGPKVRAKSVIFLHQFGGVPQQDTFDMKPDAPAELRGEFKPIPSSLPGLDVCELLPRVSRIMHQVTVVRSVNHRIGAHNSAAYYSLTGHTPQVDNVSATASASDYPAYGSIVSKLAPSQARVPTFVSMPWMIADGVFRTPGQFSGYLGKEHDSLFITKDPNDPEFSVEELTLPIEVPLERVSNRQALRSGLAAYSQLSESIAAVHGLDAYQQKALSLLTSSETKKAFDIQAEDPRLRERYGRTPYGQSVLMARRLIESGVRFVTVFYSPGIVGWDTHSNNFGLLRDKLLPTTEQTLPTLIEDLDQRGLLDDTLVVWTGEFGRTPTINKDAGRDHWPQCYTLLMAGGGMKRGFVYGASDSTAAYPKDDPCTPDDIAATMFYCLGIDPATELHNHLGQPVPVSYGTPIMPLLA
ncbi:DUF1501 domain-containing protein [Tautonia sp. JC769]|uniref:DUF1501 domain-containing protein n=1 Tax=Tautonia sp. JC769 TaxID=3232135 RepID=UPI0034597FA5